MATCIKVDKDRKSLYITYPSEPILSEAAARLMMSQEFYNSMIIKLSNQVSKSKIEGGYRGELVARLLLLRCYDQVILSN